MRTYNVGDRILFAGFSADAANTYGSGSRASYSPLYIRAGRNPRNITIRLIEGTIGYISRVEDDDLDDTGAPRHTGPIIEQPVVGIKYTRADGSSRTVDFWLRDSERTAFVENSDTLLNAAGMSTQVKEFLREFLLPKVVVSAGYANMLHDITRIIPNANILTFTDVEDVIIEARNLGIEVMRHTESSGRVEELQFQPHPEEVSSEPIPVSESGEVRVNPTTLAVDFESYAQSAGLSGGLVSGELGAVSQPVWTRAYGVQSQNSDSAMAGQADAVYYAINPPTRTGTED